MVFAATTSVAFAITCALITHRDEPLRQGILESQFCVIESRGVQDNDGIELIKEPVRFMRRSSQLYFMCACSTQTLTSLRVRSTCTANLHVPRGRRRSPKRAPRPP